MLLLDDCFTTYNEPAIGRAAVRVLERAGYAVELAGLPCCGRPMISKGFLHATRSLVQSAGAGAGPAHRRRHADPGPGAELPADAVPTSGRNWLPGPRRAAHRGVGASGRRLAGEAGSSRARCALPLRPAEEKCVLHGHCHQKALVGVGGTAAALRLVPGLDVTVLDAGCCGMAGSFGYEKEHYDLSVKIAGLTLLPALAAAPEATVVAPGTSCRHQIKDLAERRALHPLEILAEQLSAE